MLVSMQCGPHQKQEKELLVFAAMSLKKSFDEMTSLYYGYTRWKGKKTHMFDIAIELAARKKVHLDHLVSHRFSLDDYAEAVRVNVNKGKFNTVKTVFSFN